MEWAKQFYKQQFLLSKMEYEGMSHSYYLDEVEKVSEQFGKPFHKVLEIGAGVGYLANALASQEKDITTIELVDELVAFAKKNSTAPVRILCGDFYEIDVPGPFDCILYIDGFGVGEDTDQLRLLKRIHHWLKDDGYALIDIYEPNYWRHIYKGQMMPVKNSSVARQYDFDENTARLSDTWWHTELDLGKWTQSLKCYTPQQIHALCQQANLDIVGYFPGGEMNFETWSYYEPASLDYCISYRIKLKKK